MKLYDAVKSRTVNEDWGGYITAIVGNKYQIKMKTGYRWAFDYEFVLLGYDSSPKEPTLAPKNINYL